jgi:hypothetical protein
VLAAVSNDLALVGVVPDEVFEHDFPWVVERLWDDTLSTNEKGRTLEVLAGMILTRLGLQHIQLRNRSEFEVDVTADYIGTGYQTWSAQCKAYGRGQVTGEHILREFGIAILDRFSVLLFVTTSDFTEDAVLTADRIVRQTNIQVIRVNGIDLKKIAADKAALFKLVTGRSEAARRVRLGARPSEVFHEFDLMGDCSSRSSRRWPKCGRTCNGETFLSSSHSRLPSSEPGWRHGASLSISTRSTWLESWLSGSSALCDRVGEAPSPATPPPGGDSRREKTAKVVGDRTRGECQAVPVRSLPKGCSARGRCVPTGAAASTAASLRHLTTEISLRGISLAPVDVEPTPQRAGFLVSSTRGFGDVRPGAERPGMSGILRYVLSMFAHAYPALMMALLPGPVGVR